MHDSRSLHWTWLTIWCSMASSQSCNVNQYIEHICVYNTTNLRFHWKKDVWLHTNIIKIIHFYEIFDPLFNWKPCLVLGPNICFSSFDVYCLHHSTRQCTLLSTWISRHIIQLDIYSIYSSHSHIHVRLFFWWHWFFLYSCWNRRHVQITICFRFHLILCIVSKWLLPLIEIRTGIW